MKKRILLIMIIAMLTVTACGTKQNQQAVTTKNTEKSGKTTSKDDSTEAGMKDTELIDTTDEIAEEMAEIEKKSLEFENSDWDLPQQEMNYKASEWYELWDEELNSLWSRLTDVLTADDKERMLELQRDWIDRKEKNVIASGVYAYGGSLQPLLEYTMAKDMTRKQAYFLAACLAEATGGAYIAPDDVQKSYEDIDINLAEVFDKYSGTHKLGTDIELNVTRLEDSDYTADNFPEETSWLTWYSHSDVLTDMDVYAYTNDIIVFNKKSIYYVLQKSYDSDEIMLSFGNDLGQLEPVGQ